MPRNVRAVAMLGLAASSLAGCATAGSRPADRPGSAASVTPGPAPLPPMPVVQGAPLLPRLQYPADNQLIGGRDSTFVLGSVGSGDATLRINGQVVPVAPNGAFIAWLAHPPADDARWLLEAVRGVDTVRRSVRVRLPVRRALPATGRLRVDSGSLSPNGRWLLRVEEFVRVSVRAPANATAWIDLPDAARGGSARRQPMVPLAATQAATALAAAGRTGLVDAGTSGASPSAPQSNGDVGTTFATDVTGGALAGGVRVVVARGADTVRLAVPAATLVDPAVRQLAVLRSATPAATDTDRVVIARPVVDGTYKWLLLSGTVVPVTGRQGSFTRVQLDGRLEAWVATSDVVALPTGTSLPRRQTSGLRVVPDSGWVDLVIVTGERPPFLVEPDGATLRLTLYDTQANPEISPIQRNDTLVRRIAWDQVASDRVHIALTLSQPVFGWLALWDEARRAFVLRIRRPPAVDAARPLAGQVIVVDAGHPPAGATGPTGLYEGDAVLPVAERAAGMLRARGATVVSTRTTADPLGLVERTVVARRAGAHAFVSVHLNALPDGVNPFTSTGTSTLFFHQPSEPLARALQSAMTARFPFPDQGVHYQNLAVARPTWFPSALTEGAYLILPEVEAAMRTSEFQQRYADAIVAGLERYFAQWAR